MNKEEIEKLQHQNEIFDDKRKVNLAKLKYDLNDLFTNTPIFNEPPLDFSHESTLEVKDNSALNNERPNR